MTRHAGTPYAGVVYTPAPFHRRLADASLLLAIFLAVGCSPEHSATLDHQELFPLPYGKRGLSIDLFYVPGQVPDLSPALYFRGGSIYLSGGNSLRVMEATSYGEVITTIYDPSTNPAPLFAMYSRDGETVRNRTIAEYPFESVGSIAVLSDRTILVEETVDSEGTLFDDDIGLTPNRIISRFDSRGARIDYLGQEGIGGTPFPPIADIVVTNADEIVVIGESIDGAVVYWFSPAGDLMYRVEVANGQLPVPGENYRPIHIDIAPDMSLLRLYVNIDYVETEPDGASTKEGAPVSWLYSIDLLERRYRSGVPLPSLSREVRRQNVFQAMDLPVLYEMIGTSADEQVLFVSSGPGNTEELLIMRADGTVVARRSIEIADDLLVRRLHLSPDGILCGLFADDDGAQVVWWRTDRLLGVDPSRRGYDEAAR